MQRSSIKRSQSSNRVRQDNLEVQTYRHALITSLNTIFYEIYESHKKLKGNLFSGLLTSVFRHILRRCHAFMLFKYTVKR